ncbi:hypothetical protein C0991_007460, partial [Blastosporella zonata]
MSLPQYGFSADIEFDKLVETNHFLFRVYTPKAPSPFADDSEPIFIAPKFNERYARSPEEIPLGYDDHDGHHHVGTYEDVATHMDWSTKSASPYVSTSFSFIWSIWEALRRYHLGVKKDVQIAFIDASAVSKRAATAVQLLQSGSSSRRTEHWRWYRYAQESQSVLVHEYIPASAVLCSIPLVSLLEKLPSYFLRHTTEPNNKSSLAGIGWDYGEKKRSYRRFCQDMSNRFLHSTPETRLEDTTAGSVRLAMAFLRPWFHRCVFDDFQAATVTLCALSFNIAQWPGQWWVQEHSELWSLIRAMALSLAEEVREAEGNHNSKEIVRLHGVIGELENVVQEYRTEIKERRTRKPARLLTPLLIPPSLRPVAPLISPSPFRLASPSVASGSAVKVVVKTPITPPTSPIRSGPKTFPPRIPGSSPKEPSPDDSGPSQEERDICTIHSIASTPISHFIPPSPISSSESSPSELSFSIVPPSSIEAPETPVSPATTVSDQPTADLEICDDACDESLTASTSICTLERHRDVVRKPPSIAETASCVVTGFL